jgi:hypothetical protein
MALPELSLRVNSVEFYALQRALQDASEFVEDELILMDEDEHAIRGDLSQRLDLYTKLLKRLQRLEHEALITH